MGGFGVKNFNDNFRLMGGSLITNANGEIIAKMYSKEGYKISTIKLGTTLDTPIMPSIYHGKWLHPGNALYRYLIMPSLIRKGIRSYNTEHISFMKTLQKG
jgi:hypothetical protein